MEQYTEEQRTKSRRQRARDHEGVRREGPGRTGAAARKEQAVGGQARGRHAGQRPHRVPRQQPGHFLHRSLVVVVFLLSFFFFVPACRPLVMAGLAVGLWVPAVQGSAGAWVRMRLSVFGVVCERGVGR